MRNNKPLMLIVFLLITQFFFAQTKEEIIANYIENTGGTEAWNNLQGIKMTAKVSQGGMDIPIEMVQLKDGRQMTIVTFQGKEIKQGVYDGKRLWSHNFMTMEAEESDAESTANFKLESNDFPNPFLNYEKKGYTVELMGIETIQGAETFKIKLVQEPKMVDGQKEESVSYYFFDTENFCTYCNAKRDTVWSGKRGLLQKHLLVITKRWMVYISHFLCPKEKKINQDNL
jgi:hypothetical protein